MRASRRFYCPRPGPGSAPRDRGRIFAFPRNGMGTLAGWFWLIALGLFLVLTGLYIHWTVVLFGALLPFLPVLAELLRRRRNRRPPP